MDEISGAQGTESIEDLLEKKMALGNPSGLVRISTRCLEESSLAIQMIWAAMASQTQW